MTLRDLSHKNVDFLCDVAIETLAERQKSRGHIPINTVDYKLAFSDGAKATLKLIEKLLQQE